MWLIAKDYKERLDICSGCEHYQSKFNRCKECGCVLRVKAALPKSKCPLDKWPNDCKVQVDKPFKKRGA